MARINTYYCGEIKNNQDIITLSKDESHHLISVLRARKGTNITVLNGLGQSWEAQIQIADHHKTQVQLITQTKNSPYPQYPLILAQSMPKGKAFEYIIQKATEIGIMEIFPLITERTQIKTNHANKEHKQPKWEAKAIEACKQSGNLFLPRIHEPLSLELFLKNISIKFPSSSLLVTASLEPDVPPLQEITKDSIKKNSGPIILLVGPEGDFSPHEYTLARQFGFQPATLTKNILRVETATLYALSVLDHLVNSN